MPVLLIMFASLLLAAVGKICSDVGDDGCDMTFREALFVFFSGLFMCCLSIVLAIIGLMLFASENS